MKFLKILFNYMKVMTGVLIIIAAAVGLRLTSYDFPFLILNILLMGFGVWLFMTPLSPSGSEHNPRYGGRYGARH